MVRPGYGYEDFLCANCGSTLADESGCAVCGWRPSQDTSADAPEFSAEEALERVFRILRVVKKSVYEGSSNRPVVAMLGSVVAVAARFESAQVDGLSREACAVRTLGAIRSRAGLVRVKVLQRRGTAELAAFVREMLDMTSWVSPDAPGTWGPGHVEWPKSLTDEQRQDGDTVVGCPYCHRRMKVRNLEKHQAKKCRRAREIGAARLEAMGPDCLGLDSA